MRGGTTLVQATNLSEVGHRLSLVSATPITTTDQVGIGNVYMTQYLSSRVALYSLTQGWVVADFTEISIALAGLTVGKNYDVFAYASGATAALELSAAWTTDVARADALTRLNGVLVKSADTTRRYIGTIRATAAATTEDSLLQRYVWNFYNRMPRQMIVRDDTNSWIYNSNVFRQANANAANVVKYVCGDIGANIRASIFAMADQAGGGANPSVGIGIDVTNANSAQFLGGSNTGATSQILKAEYYGYPGLGYHALNWLEAVISGTCTYYGDAANPNHIRSGLQAEVLG